VTKDTAILDLPPAYVEVWKDLLPPRTEEAIAVLKQDDGHHEPPDGPHDHNHDHVEDGSRAPVLRRIIPTSGRPGDTITLLGSNFGAVQGDSFVTIGGVTVSIV